MKKKHIRITVGISIIIIFILLIGILLIGKDNKNEKVKLGKATFPTIKLELLNVPVNTLYGYKEEMEIPFVRDTITPVVNGGKININVSDTDAEMLSVSYEIISLDGKSVLLKDEAVSNGSGAYTIDTANTLEEQRESVLKIIVNADEENIYYYTRITDGSELNADKCLNFAKNFQQNTFDKKKKDNIAKYLEPDWEKSNNTFKNVDIHSNIYHVTWGNMEPEIKGEVLWDIKETNSVYTSFVSEYQVVVNDEDKGSELFNIKEYYRVRFLKDKIYLLNFDRTMNQVFDSSKDVVSKDGIILGIASSEVEYDGSSDGRYTAFVQERVLWLFDKEENEFSCVFGFSDRDDTDIRDRNDDHSIRIIDVDKEGNIVFLVSGYMNRGQNEGHTGVAVCYFEKKENIVTEKAFIPDTRSGHLTSAHLGQMIYYSPNMDTVNYIMNDNLYSVKSGKKDADILIENIPDGEFVVSNDNHLFACKTAGDEEIVKIFNFNTGESLEINAPDGKVIKPLGFIKNDIIYGIAATNKMVELDTSKVILPVDKLEIRDEKNTVVKEYTSKDMIITGIDVEDSLITIYRASKGGDTYVTEKEDYISNNEENKSKAAKPETFYTEFQETQVYLSFAEKHEDSRPKVKYPEFAFDGNIITNDTKEKAKEREYYVYGKGLAPEVYSDPSKAIERAGKITGVVVDENQKYIWEKGNRDLTFFNKVENFNLNPDKSELELCEDALAAFPGTKTRINGISFSDVCYIINNGSPAIAKVSEEKYILITGYNLDNVEYIDPKDGELHYESVKSMEEKLKANGNMFAVNL